MVKFEARHDDGENHDNAQVTGSTVLRDVLKDTASIKGSFSLNGFEFTNFQAGSPEAVVAAINVSTNQTGVTASIDDAGHLVLNNNDPQDIVIKLGKPFDEPPPVGGSVGDEVVRKLKADGKPAPANEVLDTLGLEATPDDESGVSASSHPDQNPRRDEDTRDVRPRTSGQPVSNQGRADPSR